MPTIARLPAIAVRATAARRGQHTIAGTHSPWNTPIARKNAP